ncbi:PDGF_2 domain-containing protein [Caerostris extrusa]|uniref:PDGF_2 domain-containing protein n=1 Tax=Caerostris extrusa TaxID=172846 RepID=A0AAV4SM24_CAEEX|nr:PDGF_2 domain-containing protein [Caerostris extrusa]
MLFESESDFDSSHASGLPTDAVLFQDFQPLLQFSLFPKGCSLIDRMSRGSCRCDLNESGPPATIIHRCGESTGCCDFDYEKCVAKKKHHVTLYAFVKPRLGDGSFVKRNGRNRIKKFVFTNHTECHCVDAGRFILK